MKIIIDSREQTPLHFTQIESERGTLQTGDYSIQGLEHLFSVERKSLDDCAASVSRERARFERELHRLRGFRFKRLLIVGSRADIEVGRYRSKVSPKAVLASLAAFEVRYDVPVVFAPTPEDAARLIESWAHWFCRQIAKDAEPLVNSGLFRLSPGKDTPREMVSSPSPLTKTETKNLSAGRTRAEADKKR